MSSNNVQTEANGGSGTHVTISQRLYKIWTYVSVEPVLFCLIVPSFFLYIAIENLSLEKSCRVNLNYSDVVCDNMIDKSLNNINCPEFREKLKEPIDKAIHLYRDRSQVMNETHFTNGTAILQPNAAATILFDISELELLVCQAEIESQKLDTRINLVTTPFETIFGIVMVLFAGGWSDKNRKRKPCMLIPMLGELSSYLVLLTSAIFFKQLPLEFNSILGKLLPAATGGLNLMLMGVYSYLSETTAEEDRTFRFSVFAQFVQVVSIFSLPFAGPLFQSFGYVKLLLLCIPLNILGILYLLFVLKEPKEKVEAIELSPGVDNPAFTSDTNGPSQDTGVYHKTENKKNKLNLEAEQTGKNCLREFFNPVVAVQCLKVLTRKRANWGRATVCLVLFMYFIALGPAFGEEPNAYNFTRIQLNWDGTLYSTFATYGTFLALIGTIVMTTVLSKMLRLSDPILGFIGTVLSCVSKILYTMATTITMMYVAQTFDAFTSVRALVIRSIISKLVDPDELGRSFSMIAIIEAFDRFVFLSFYSIIYERTLETWPGAIFFVSFIILSITACLFLLLHFVLKRKEITDSEKEQQMTAIQKTNDQTKYAETTHM